MFLLNILEIFMQVTTKSAVVSNDTNTSATATKEAAFDMTAAASLQAMENKRTQWQNNAFRTSNQQLYSVLADCLSYGAPLDTAAAKLRATELQAFLKERKLIVKRESPLMTRIVKAVFGDVDRRRVSTYSLVLRSAQKEGVLPSALAEWIEQRGGIQEIRLSKSATYISPKSKAEMVQKHISTMSALGSVSSKQLSEMSDSNYVGEECVLIAEQQADGSFAIKSVVRSATALNAALLSMYSENAEAFKLAA